MPEESSREYFRRDRPSGISPPDLSKQCTYAEHIVRARGKRTQYTSVSLNANRLRDFGDQLYQLLRPQLTGDGHALVEHEALVQSLRNEAAISEKAERAKAIAAVRYARSRVEGLVAWQFDISRVVPKDVVQYGERAVQKYFAKA